MAMLVGEDLSRVGMRFGLDKTHSRDLIRMLRFYGARCADRMRAVDHRKPLPPLAILNVPRGVDTCGHWVVVAGGKIFDPLGEDAILRRRPESYLRVDYAPGFSW